MTHPGWAGDPVLDDLGAETASLIGLVDGLDRIDTVTPSEPWTIRDQLSHLAAFDEQAVVAATDPDRFVADLGVSFADGGDALMQRHFATGRALTPAGVVDWFHRERARLIEAFGRLDPDERIPWYGPPMKTRSSVVARLMETWAHGLDVADALAVAPPPTDRLFHIAELGVKTFRFSFENRGLETPAARARVELTGPSGTVRVWNPDADDTVTGPVQDFCMVVAQRRHLSETSLVVTGPVATAWMRHAQVFAGPPGPGRPPSRDTA